MSTGERTNHAVKLRNTAGDVDEMRFSSVNAGKQKFMLCSIPTE